MNIVAELEERAKGLTDSQRATLACHLLDSLQHVLHDDDEGLAEAIKRDKEMDSDPSSTITHDELMKAFGH